MKFKLKLGHTPADAEISVDGKRLEDEVLQVEFVVRPGQIPHVVLVLKPSEVEIETPKTSVTQSRAEAPPPPPAPPAPPAPNRAARRATEKKKAKK